MSEQAISEQAPTVQHVAWHLDYHVHLGGTWSTFMHGLSEREIKGTRCDHCGRVFVPPQSLCESCLEPATSWVDIAPRGVLRTFTVSHHAFEGSPPAPYGIGAVQLDGADTMLLHFVGPPGAITADELIASLRIGDRMRVVWAETRRGHILDIAHFEPDRDDAGGAR